MKKKEEVQKCLSLLKRVNMCMTALQGLNLSGIEQELLKGALPHIEHIKTNLYGVYLGRELEPEEAARELEQKLTQGSGGRKI